MRIEPHIRRTALIVAICAIVSLAVSSAAGAHLWRSAPPAPTLTVAGDDLSWNRVGWGDRYEVLRNIPGQRSQIFFVEATKVDPQHWPCKALGYRVRSVFWGNWSNEVQITYPCRHHHHHEGSKEETQETEKKEEEYKKQKETREHEEAAKRKEAEEAEAKAKEERERKEKQEKEQREANEKAEKEHEEKQEEHKEPPKEEEKPKEEKEPPKEEEPPPKEEPKEEKTSGAGTIKTRLDAKTSFDSFPLSWFSKISRLLAYPTAGDRYPKAGVPTVAYHDAWTTWGSKGATHVSEYVAWAKRDQNVAYIGQFMDDVNFQGSNIAGTRAQYRELIEAVRNAIGPTGVIEINAQFWNIWPLIQKKDPDVLKALEYVNVVTKEFNVDPAAGITTASKYREFTEYVQFLHDRGIHITMTGDSKHNTTADKEYSLATYLLVNDAGDFIGFSEQGPGKEYAGLTLNLGEATSGKERSSNGVWERKFAGGLAFTLEPGSSSQTIQLPKAMKTLEGQTVMQVTLAAAHGAVLLN